MRGQDVGENVHGGDLEGRVAFVVAVDEQSKVLFGESLGEAKYVSGRKCPL